MSNDHMAMRAGPILTDQQIRTFREDGFLAIQQLISNEVVGQLRDAYDDLLTGKIDGGEDSRLLGGVVRQVMYPHKHHPYFADNPAKRAAEKLAHKLMDDEPEFFYDMLISKGPGDTNPTVWHQDHAYGQIPFAPAGSIPPNEWVQFWVALDDVDQETGCMTFIPGSHQGALRPHYVFAGDLEGENRMLATNDCDDSRSVSCPLPAGGCTVHLDGTLHYTDGNHSKNRPRRAYIFSFRPKDAAWLT